MVPKIRKSRLILKAAADATAAALLQRRRGGTSLMAPIGGSSGRSRSATHRHPLTEGFQMASKNTAVFGIYRTPDDAERAVDALMGNGFSSSAISVLLPDNESTRAFAHHKDTKAPEGTAAGVTTGGAIGGALGVLAGVGALAVPGIGPFIAAGPIMAGLAGLGVGGAVGGLV